MKVKGGEEEGERKEKSEESVLKSYSLVDCSLGSISSEDNLEFA